MYLDFYNLKEKPFNVTSDPNFLFMSRRHREALTLMLYGIRERKGFLEITGEVGTGKTTLCRVLLNSLDERTEAAFIFNSDLPEMQLLKAIVEDLGVGVPGNTKIKLFNQLNRYLIDRLKNNRNVVLILDEAQNLKPRVLEQLRMLSNLETEKDKLFQIILVGQPELRSKLESPNLRQLRQRISVRYHVLPLEGSEVVEYIKHRLLVAGSRDSVSFTDSAMARVFEYSHGVPRLINILCDKALLLGFVLEKREIDEEIVERCVDEIEGRIMV